MIKSKLGAISLTITALIVSYLAILEISFKKTTLPNDIDFHYVRTEDGWELAVAEFPGTKDKEVIYLQHGLAGRHIIFDLYPHGPSMARWLASQGYHVFAGNLRGRPPSRKPAGYKEKNWRYSDYLLRDAPAIIDFIHQKTGKKIHWVGLSMGGIIGLPYAAMHGKEQLASITTMGSALHYGVGGSSFEAMHRWRKYLSRFKELPTSTIQKFIAPLVAAGVVSNEFLYNRDNVTAETVLTLGAHNYINSVRSELEELGTTFLEPGIRSIELDQRLIDISAKLPVPWLCVAGTMDRQSPEKTIQWTYERVEAPKKEWFTAGRSNGHQEEYGHMDLVCGKNAQSEVWPRIVSFIEQNKI